MPRRACRSRIPSFVRLSRTIRTHREGILAAEGALTFPVTRTFSLHDLHEGLELLGTGQARGKYVVTLEG